MTKHLSHISQLRDVQTTLYPMHKAYQDISKIIEQLEADTH